MLEANVILFILGVVNFIVNLQKWAACKKKVEIIEYKWSTRLNQRIPRNRLYLFFLFIYLLASLYFLLSPPRMSSDYTMLIFFFLVMSFAPKWNVAVGPTAIILGTRIIPSEEILDRKLVVKGKSRFLQVKSSSKDGRSLVKEKIVPFPFQQL